MEADALIRQLEATGEFRVLRRFVPRERYDDAGPDGLKQGLVVDVETTGLDPAADAIIELAAVPFTFRPTDGAVVTVEAPATWLEDPGRAIPREVVELTGITQEMVAGQRIDDAAATALVERADLIIAHNAAFDRRFLNRRLPACTQRFWACSQREIPWKREVGASAALEFLLIKHCGMFFQGHRAAVDCQALVHLLATPLASGGTPLRWLLESARRTTARIWAVDAPYDAKDALKTRGYSWNGGGDGRPKAWFREVAKDDVEAEKAWLAANAYGGRPGNPRVDLLTARNRYSE